MLMNRVESALIDSGPRRLLQHYEANLLIKLGGRTPGAHIAELGCGPGYGTRLILDTFGAASVDAVDLDPKMLAKARRRLQRHGERVYPARGSATVLAEFARVLTPGGRFFSDEATATALARPTYQVLFDHPAADRYSATASALNSAG